MSSSRPRLLVLGGKSTQHVALLDSLKTHFEVDIVEHLQQALTTLRHGTYHAIFADVGDFLPLERDLSAQQANLIIDTIGEGVCIIDSEGACAWSNGKMRAFPPEVFHKVKQISVQARLLFSNQVGSIMHAGHVRSKKFTIQSEDDRYFEVVTSPVLAEQGDIKQVVAVVWDATGGKRLQQKIDAIDAAGRELARLDSEAIAKLSPGQRLQLLEDKIIRYSKNLMHFDHFAIRVLDKRTNKLELVVAEGLPDEATEIDLYAQPEGNGISGYVAATGRSYICHDTEKDPRYVIGMEHAKSSLTVPLRMHDQLIGVFNIESDRVGAFNEDDRQFAEIFGRYVAAALHTLDMLVVERCAITGQLAENVVSEMAQPLNDIVTDAQTLMEDYIGDDSMRQRLNTIVENVQSIREKLKGVQQGPQRVLDTDKLAEPMHDPILTGKKVLVADDEPTMCRTVGDILKKRGCEVTFCKDGYEAIAMVEQQTFDLIVSDIRMPHRNGYEIFAAARRKTDRTPVILMTGFGYDPHHSIVRATQEGLSSVLYKPFKVDDLLGEVRKALAPASTPVPAPTTTAKPA